MKIKVYIYTCFVFFSFYHFSLCQVHPGAKQISLSHSGVAYANDVFALFNNPAGLAQLNWRELGIYYSPSPFGVPELANAYAVYTEPLAFGNVSAGYMNYGFELYRESKIALSYAAVIKKKFLIGITALYQNLSIEKYGNDNALVFNIGGIYYLDENTRVGFYTHNISKSTYGEEEDQIPFILAVGASRDFQENITFNFGVEKELDYNPSFRFGIEYIPIKYFSLRSGFMNEPSSYSFGAGIHYSFLNLDYAFFTHQDLGLTHQAGIVIDFEPSRSRREKIHNFLFEK